MRISFCLFVQTFPLWNYDPLCTQERKKIKVEHFLLYLIFVGMISLCSLGFLYVEVFLFDRDIGFFGNHLSVAKVF